VATFYCLRPFVVLVYTFVEHSVEAWACEVGKKDGHRDADGLCRELRAARYLLVPMLVLGVAFLSLVVWQRLGVWRRECVRAGGGDREGTVQGKV
jgi:hypothetical protein